MIKKSLISVFTLFIGLFTAAYGQTVENAGWFFYSNTQKITEKIDILSDLQLRSADKFEYVNTLLLRVAFNYNFNKKHSAGLGYAYKADWEEKEDRTKTYSPEHRIFEQYLYNLEAGSVELNGRFRLEQRFVKTEGIVDFSQRARTFISAQIPLVADTGFTKGLFTKIQNEVFLNVQNNDKVNDSVFDQNRTLISLGYRFSKKIDLDLGYMYWYQKEMNGNTRTNVWQIMLTTEF